MKPLYRKILYSLTGCLVLLALIQIIGVTGVVGKSWPPLTDVTDYLTTPHGRDLITRNTVSTVTSAAYGLVAGTVAAVLAAMLALLIPLLRQGFDRLAAILYAIPTIALAPLLITTVGRTNTPVVIAALSVGFVMFVAMTSAFSGTGAAYQDVFTVLGSNRLRRLANLELPAALPAFFDGLTMAAPAAVLGATIGEWFGAPEGLGMVIVSAMQNFQIPLLWSAAASATVVALCAYLVCTVSQRLISRRFA
jgi:ABC-type nitrate/sulfonate/bicarbonate transport system permease component